MKTTIRRSLGALLLTGALITASSVVAQTQRIEATQTTTTAEGTLSEFGPQSIVIKTEAGSTPVRYLSRETTNYVDQDGNPVAMASVNPGHPVTVYYTKVGDTMVASKVMVRAMAAGTAQTIEAPQVTTTTRVRQIDTTQPIATAPPRAVVTTQATTSDGTVTEFGPDEFVLRTTSSADPLRYTYGRTTTYVDEAGAPVSVRTVKSGIPVTVYSTQDGDTLRASKVIVRSAVTTTPTPIVRIAVPERAPGIVTDTETAPVIVKKHAAAPDPEPVIVRKHVVAPDPAPAIVKGHVIAPDQLIEVKKTTTTTTTTTDR